MKLLLLAKILLLIVSGMLLLFDYVINYSVACVDKFMMLGAIVAFVLSIFFSFINEDEED